MSTFEKRMKRLNDAISLKEPDRVPIVPHIQGFPAFNAGYSMADVIYDFDKAAQSIKKFATDYNPDAVIGHGYMNFGAGPILELTRPKVIEWAGSPSGKVDKDSVHQFLEFEVLKDDEMELFSSDYSNWLVSKAFPRVSALLEPMESWNLASLAPRYDIGGIAAMLSTPKSREMIETLWKLNDMKQELSGRMSALNDSLEEMGYPVVAKGSAAVPFDNYSDYLRGTLSTMTDMYDSEDIIKQYCKTNLEQTLQSIRAQGKRIPGRWVFMALHKGMDSFLTPKQYRDFYWKDLQVIIEEIINNGMVPCIFTEGKYDSRLECLKEVTPGKVLYHFETCDMREAKKVLGNTACISGGLPVYVLNFGTRQQVIDECKRLLDICAPGGGFILETDCGLDKAKPENVEAMCEAVLEYGKY